MNNLSHIKIEPGTNKNFGLVFSVVFGLFFSYKYLVHSEISYIALIICLIFLGLALFLPKLLAPFNLVWFKFGLLLGAITSPIIMAIVFFILITPIAIFFRLKGRDILKLNKNHDSLWTNMENKKLDMTKQF